MRKSLSLTLIFMMLFSLYASANLSHIASAAPNKEGYEHYIKKSIEFILGNQDKETGLAYF